MFKEVREIKEKIYVLFKKDIVENYRNRIYMILEDKEQLKNPMITSDYVVYIGTELLKNPFLQEDGILREATGKELIDKGLYILEDYEVLVGDDIKNIYEFPIPEELIIPQFDKENLVWIESATSEDKVSFWKNRCKEISQQMLVLEKAGLEGDCEYITLQAMLADYKDKYMTASHELALEMDKVF